MFPVVVSLLSLEQLPDVDVFVDEFLWTKSSVASGSRPVCPRFRRFEVFS